MADSITDAEAPASTVLLGPEGQVALPEAIRRAAGLGVNRPVSVALTPEGILLKPVEIDPEQAWYWTPEWQAKEREADEDLAAGRFARYHSDEEFLRSFDELRHPDADV